MVYVGIVSIMFMGALASSLRKSFQLGIKNNFTSLVLVNIIQSFLASIYFMIVCKFHIEMNMATFIYSLAYAFLAFSSIAVAIIALSKISLALHTILQMSGSIIGSTLIGILVFNEKVTIFSILSLITIFISVVLPLAKKIMLDKNRVIFIVMIIDFILPFLASIFLKFYAEAKGVCSSNNMFFMTNVICFLISVIVILMVIKTKGVLQTKKDCISVLKPDKILNRSFSVLVDGTAEIVRMYCIAHMAISAYTIITSAASIILDTLISKFTFREKLDIPTVLSIIFAVMAIVFRTL